MAPGRGGFGGRLTGTRAIEPARVAFEVVLAGIVVLLRTSGLFRVVFGLPGKVEDLCLKLGMFGVLGHVGLSWECYVDYETAWAAEIFLLTWTLLRQRVVDEDVAALDREAKFSEVSLRWPCGLS